jgi:uncharacterized protein
MALTPIKLCVIGPFGVGKTTFIRAISETPVVETEVHMPINDGQKTTTTVGIDFGTVTIGDAFELLLFGVPGQLRFEAVWKTCLSGTRASILLIDGANPNWREDFQFYRGVIERLAPNTPYVIGFNRIQTGFEIPSDIAAIAPAIRVDVRERETIRALLKLLIRHAQNHADTAPPI